MPLFILSVAIQVAFVIHIIKTGRNTTWIWIVVILPMAGSIAYLLMEILPELLNSRAGRNASRKIQSTISPNKDFDAAAKQFSISNTVENSMRLADECYNKGLFAEAKKLFEKCMSGPHADDPYLMFGLAKSDFQLGNYSDVVATLDKLIELNPDYKNQDAHLLYARALEKSEQISAALHEYETLHGYFSGAEASYYFARFLKSQNMNDKAREVFQHIVDKAKNSGRHYNTLNKEFIKQARIELS